METLERRREGFRPVRTAVLALTERSRSCHSERSEESPVAPKSQIVSSNLITKKHISMRQKEMYETPVANVLIIDMNYNILSGSSTETPTGTGQDFDPAEHE